MTQDERDRIELAKAKALASIAESLKIITDNCVDTSTGGGFIIRGKITTRTGLF